MMPEGRDTSDPRHRLLEQFQILPDELRADGGGQPGDIAARLRQVGDEPACDWIEGPSKDDGDGLGRLLGGEGGLCVRGHDDIDVQRNQLAYERREPLELPLGGSEFDDDRLALDVTEVTQSLTEGLRQLRARGQVGRHIAYARDLGQLLGRATMRTGEKATGQRAEEGAPGGHWIGVSVTSLPPNRHNRDAHIPRLPNVPYELRRAAPPARCGC
jgi:hypothetical protein